MQATGRGGMKVALNSKEHRKGCKDQDRDNTHQKIPNKQHHQCLRVGLSDAIKFFLQPGINRIREFSCP